MEAEIFVKRLILFGAIEDNLVAIGDASLINQELDHLAADALPPDGCCDDDILNMSHDGAIMEEFVFEQEGGGREYLLILRIDHDIDAMIRIEDGVEELFKLLGRGVFGLTTEVLQQSIVIPTVILKMDWANHRSFLSSKA